jgi:hypothetical protein
MNIKQIIEEKIAENGSTKQWVFDRWEELMLKTGKKVTGYKNFNKKLKEDNFDAYDLLILGIVLKINLNDLKKQIKDLE